MTRALQVRVKQANNSMAEAKSIINYERHRIGLEEVVTCAKPLKVTDLYGR
jgi:hypothetical protein